MKIKPLHDNVVVKRDDAEGKSKGGIILPDNAKEAPKRGTVVAVGPGRPFESSPGEAGGSRQEMSVKENDKVYFSAYAGSEIEVEGQKLLILAEKEILAVIQ